MAVHVTGQLGAGCRVEADGKDAGVEDLHDLAVVPEHTLGVLGDDVPAAVDDRHALVLGAQVVQVDAGPAVVRLFRRAVGQEGVEGAVALADDPQLLADRVVGVVSVVSGVVAHGGGVAVLLGEDGVVSLWQSEKSVIIGRCLPVAVRERCHYRALSPLGSQGKVSLQPFTPFGVREKCHYRVLSPFGSQGKI